MEEVPAAAAAAADNTDDAAAAAAAADNTDDDAAAAVVVVAACADGACRVADPPEVCDRTKERPYRKHGETALDVSYKKSCL